MSPSVLHFELSNIYCNNNNIHNCPSKMKTCTANLRLAEAHNQFQRPVLHHSHRVIAKVCCPLLEGRAVDWRFSTNSLFLIVRILCFAGRTAAMLCVRDYLKDKDSDKPS